MVNASNNNSAVATPAPAPLKKCLCGCGENVTSKVNYRPGHDARHVSALARAVNSGAQSLSAVYALLPTETLQGKLAKQVANLADKAVDTRNKLAAREAAKVERDAAKEVIAQNKANAAQAKADKAAAAPKSIAPEDERTLIGESSVKIGRWQYPTRTFDDGVTERNTKADGSGKWVKHTL